MDITCMRLYGTGITLSWTPGPVSNSLEAAYPFVITNDRIAYHANPNVCTIATALNYPKKRQAAICLPLIAQAIICKDDTSLNFESRKSRMAWLYNGLTKAATMGHIFSLGLPLEQKSLGHLSAFYP
ncbi:hypothetical protein TgHK011_003742 [Trichoderma gracile]|nr:hypothetical protein TgHK011_003742 [Trichoderma gracile]